MGFAIASRGDRHPGRLKTRGPMTDVEVRQGETFVAPVSQSGGQTRPEVWEARSLDGLWTYHRVEHVGSPWSVVYLPTGQQRDNFASLPDAREATADWLLAELRGEAHRLAYGRRAASVRAKGQRWLAIHMRMAGGDETDGPCYCGGLVVKATTDGQLAHVDACRSCHTPGKAGITTPCTGRGHLFCGDPTIDRTVPWPS